jgi:subtilisin family serine protease/alpha-tubulin suppressor-like RCC1 family protein/uncharacterized membrane protein
MKSIEEITLEVVESENTIEMKDELNGDQLKRTSLRKTSFKYPYLIVEESLTVDSEGKETVHHVEALVADHLIVNLQPHVDLEMAKDELNDLNCSLGDKITEGVYLLKIQGKPSIDGHFEKRELLNEIDHLIEIVEPDYFVTIVKSPNDTYRNRLWGMHNTGQTGGTQDKDIDGPEAWDKTTGSKNVLGAVIDTGIDRNHEDLKANMWTNPGEIAGNGKDDDGNGFIDDVHGWDFVNNDNNPHDDHSHGTHCAGTIGGVGNNGKGVVGVAWNVSMVGIKFLSRSGSGSSSDAIKSVAYATKIGVDFTSNSWGGGGSSSSLKRVIEEAGKKGIGFIAAAGNHNGNNDSRPSYPASYDLDNVIAVGSHDHRGNRASSSCYGKKSVDLFAPGVSIYSTVPGNRYATYSGTSMATPHVAGAYALVQSLNSDWTCKQIKETLMNSTDAESSLKDRCVTGGRLNAFKALQTEPSKERLIAAKPAKLDFGQVRLSQPKTLELIISNPGSDETTITKASITKEITKAENLIGHWTFDEGTGSSAANSGTRGNTYKATLIGGATFSTQEKKFGTGALHIPASQKNAMARVNSPLKLGGGSYRETFSISAWFKKLYASNNGWRTLSRGSSYGHHLIVGSGNDSVGVYANSNGDWRDSGEFDMPAKNPQNAWHHIVAVSDKTANRTKFFLNGQYKGDSDRPTGNNIYSIGNHYGGGQRFAEYLDDFRVYDIALSADEAKSIFNEDKASSPFSFALQTPVKLAPGKGIKASVTFTGREQVKSAANLLISSDAKNNPTLSIQLSAEVTTTPDLVVNPESMYFDLKGNETKTQALTLSNKGDGELTYQVSVLGASGNPSKKTEAFGMGYNYSGLLGDGTSTTRSKPVQAKIEEVVKLGTGGFHNLFLKKDGSLWSIGYNRYGQLGDGTNSNRSTPVQIQSNGVKTVQAGISHSLFVKNDGSLWAMGYNNYGMLGDGTTASRSKPVQVVKSGVKAVAAGRYHSLFLKDDGSLWAMGRNQYGQLGDGTNSTRLKPIQVRSGGVKAIASGGHHSLFLNENGSLWGMGFNSNGQIGDGSGRHLNKPVQIQSVNIKKIAAGEQHSLFLKEDGSAWGMGSNVYGQLGDGTRTKRLKPVRVQVGNAIAIAGGDSHSLFITNDGSLWSVGRNSYGQLGDGTKTHRSNPVRIETSGVSTIATGSHHTLFLMGEGKTFFHGFKHVMDKSADQYLVEKSNLRTYSEWQTPPVTYWGPTSNNNPATLTYKYSFGYPLLSAKVRIPLASFNFGNNRAQGSSSAWASKDRKNWTLLLNNPVPNRIDSYKVFEDLIPSSLLGGKELYIQIRLQVSNAPNSSYTTAQFARSTSNSKNYQFYIEANCSSEKQNWLTINSENGSIKPGQSKDLDLSAHASKMPTEYEEAHILISSNDPDEPQKKIKVTAQKLSEKAGLVFRPSSLSFENTYVGQTAEKPLILSNAGTKELTVTQFVFRDSAFSHRLSLPFTLKAGEKRDATIYFTPQSAGKVASSALVLTNEDGGKTRTFQISGEGSLAPVMVITPSSLSATLKSKQERTMNLRISNSGGSPLTWTLKGATTGGGKSLSAPFFAQSHFTPMEKGAPDNREGMPVSTLGGGPDLHGYNWTDSNDAAGPAHQWKDISKTGKLLSEASKADDAFDKVALPFAMELYGKTFKEVFVSSNGYLTFGKGSSEHSHFPLPTTMMAGNLIAPFAMDLDPSRGGEVYVQQTANEFLVQWNRVKDFAGIGEYTFQASLNRNGVIYFHYEKMDGKIERATTGIQNEAADKALLIAYNNQQVKADSTIRISTSPKWLHVATTSGTIGGGKYLNVPVTFKSGGILAGTYKAILGINGNDPKRPSAEVPVSLTIQATRTLAVNPTTVDFGQVSVGSSGEKTVQFTNTGNAAISIGQINTGNGVFTASAGTKSLAPGETSSLLLRFSPVNGTSYTSTAQVYSNAENSPTRISLRGKGIASPRFAFNPENLSITVAAGQKTKSLASLLNKGKAMGNFRLKEIRNEANGKNGIGVDGPTAEQTDPFADEHVPNRLIVRYKDGQSGLSNPGALSTQVKIVRELAKARKTGNGARALNGLNLDLVETVQSANLRDVAKALAEDPAVEYVEPDYIRRSSVLPNDPEWRNQYALQKIQAPQAWEKTKGSHSVIVAVIDTGIDYNHKDLQGNIWKNPGEIANNRKDDDGNGYVDDVYGWDFCNNDNNPMDGNRHGTHVAGTIAAASDNGLQVAGVAWNTKLVALKFLSDRGWGSISDAIDAVAYCTAMDFPISNNSWGGGGSSRAMKEAIDRAGQNGHLFCAAAGNSGTNNDSRPHYPSSYVSPNVLSVAASDSADRLASFTCYGKTSVDMAAPGVSILNLVPNNRLARLSGTSMATPHVAGAAALVLSMNQNAGFAELKRTLMDSVDPIKSYEGKMVAPGRLNLLKALEGFSPGWLSVSPENGSVAAGNSSTLTFGVDASNLTAGTKRAIVCFETNDPLAKVLEFPVKLTVTGDPKIATDKKSLDFGELWVGNKKELQLTVSNPGTADLKVSSLTLGHKDLTVTPSTLSLKAGEKRAITILANPKSSGTVSTHLTIVSNAKNFSDLKVPVAFKSVLPPSLLVSPKSISRTLEPNQKGAETLSLSNVGQASAVWDATLVETERSRSRNRDLNALLEALNNRAPEFNNPGIPVDQIANASSEKGSEAAFRILGGNPNSSLEVAILGANYTDGNKDVALGLAETKRFAGITVIDVKSVTPTVKELQAFDTVLVHSNYSYRDTNKLGDNVTAFAKDGGGVVSMVCENLTYKGSEKWTLGGQWKKEGHAVFAPSKTLVGTSSSMGEKTMPSHPLLSGVRSFAGKYRLSHVQTAKGAQIVAKWKDGQPLVTFKSSPFPVVDLNFYPVSKRKSTNGWDTKTDGWKLMANALEWSANGSVPNWIESDTLAGSIKGNGTSQAKLSFDATDLSEGNYSAEFRVSSNDPSKPYQTVAIKLTVRKNAAPVAKPTLVNLIEDSSKVFKLMGSDPEGESISYILVDQPKNGRLVGKAPDLTYVPNANYNGTDELSFKVSDGARQSDVAKVQFRISAVNDAPWVKPGKVVSMEDEPVVLGLQFGDPDGDDLQLEVTQKPQNGFMIKDNGKWLYFPNPHYNGGDSLKFRVFDGKLRSNEATLVLDIKPSNDAPIASDMKVTAQEGKRVTFQLVAADVDGDLMTYELITAPKHGKIEAGKNKSWAYTPLENYNGSDSLTFRVSDGKVRGNLAQVTFEVTPRNEAPVVASSTFALMEDGELKVKLIASDPEGDKLTFKITASTKNGSLTGNGPSYTYKPKTNYNGTDRFTIVANDGQSNSQPAVITLEVSSQNDAPKLTSGIGTLSASYRETTFRMKLEAEDPDGDELVYALGQKPVNGTCSIEGDQLVYMPNRGFTGIENLNIEVSDGELSETATIELPIREHPGSVGLFLDVKGSDKSADLLHDLYAMNERLSKTADYLIKLDLEQVNESFVGTVSEREPDAECISLNQWKDQIKTFDPETTFTFYPQMENGEISWFVGSFLQPIPSADTEVDDKSSYSDKDKVEDKNEQQDPGESPDSPDSSSAPSEKPIVTISDLPTVVSNEQAHDWYSLNGLGNFFDAGNGWVYQPEMGWCFTEVCQDDLSLWVYSEGLGWMWIKSEFPNMCYMEGEVVNGWSYFPKESVTEAGLLFDYANDTWIKLK